MSAPKRLKKSLVLYILLLGFSAFSAHAKSDAMNYFAYVLAKVKENYVREISDQELIEYAIAGMLSGLDPHSMYLDEHNYRSMQNTTQGEFGGIGVEIMPDANILRVIAPYEDSPAFKAGIRPGDAIVGIDGVSVSDMQVIDAIDKLRGAPGSIVTVKVARKNGELLEFEIMRDYIKLVPLRSKLLVGNTIAYIRLSSFNTKVAALVKTEYLQMDKESKRLGSQLDGLVLDLRWNPGGLLEQGVAVADLFLSGAQIVRISSRQPELNQIYKANPYDITGGIPLVVLINEGSSSASEIVAGALQDNKRAIVVGTRSFGKGSVQAILPLKHNTAMKITTAIYYTPSGVNIQAKGISPDVYVQDSVVVKRLERQSISEASLKGHIKLQGSSTENDKSGETAASMIYENDMRKVWGDEEKDFQLIRAIDVLKSLSICKRANDLH